MEERKKMTPNERWQKAKARYEKAKMDMRKIENIFAGYREQQRKDAHAELAEFLPRLSEKGSGDDLSVAIVCRKK